MASLNFFVPPIATTQRRVVYTRATSAKNSGGSKEEKSILDFVIGAITKEDQLLETDPILQKVEGKSGTGTTTVSSKKKSVSVPPPKKNSNGFGGLGGLFAKKE
ncbi:uncharacterized protein LOC132050462 [Lycium ferocissimum]|uniref:uncharacterized protein LOC132050462 n=1 Tax=Lycium ferocissimum TaxID=112874 RepID=UPI0028162368|nr:uncharacterized protein LOC132050462 [Lycium ferocissimum]